ncbi:MAG: hypothetical protein K2J73_08515 [Oscillospiraceae bacterium]|nr:hypothetical protein [Oscillospiraceae bacterium]
MTVEELLNKLEKIVPNERAIENIDYDIHSIQLKIGKLEDEIKRLERKRDDISLENEATKETVNKMPTNTYRKMLKLHYIDDKTWETVAEAINYSVKQLYNYRFSALEECLKTWNEK